MQKLPGIALMHQQDLHDRQRSRCHCPVAADRAGG
jgi:hypothetical protein